MQQPPSASAPTTRSDDTTLAVLAHAGTLAGYIIPFGNILAPLLILLTRGKTSPLVEDHAKESLNFQISLTLYALVALAILFVLFIAGALAMTMGPMGDESVPFFALFMMFFPAYLLVAAFELIVIVLASVRASKGQRYRYPLTIRLVR